MIEIDTFVLHEHMPTATARRCRHGDTVVIWVGTSRLTGRVTYVDRVRDWIVVWVRVPVVDIPLPACLA